MLLLLAYWRYSILVLLLYIFILVFIYIFANKLLEAEELCTLFHFNSPKILKDGLFPISSTATQILPRIQGRTLRQVRTVITKQAKCQLLRCRKLLKITGQNSVSHFLKENIGGIKKIKTKQVIESSWLSCQQKSVSASAGLRALGN